MRRAYQSKGGKAHTAKGFAKMDKNRHLEVSSRGGKQRSENYSSKGADQTQDSVGINPEQLADVLAGIEETHELQE